MRGSHKSVQGGSQDKASAFKRRVLFSATLTVYRALLLTQLLPRESPAYQAPPSGPQQEATATLQAQRGQEYGHRGLQLCRHFNQRMLADSASPSCFSKGIWSLHYWASDTECRNGHLPTEGWVVGSWETWVGRKRDILRKIKRLIGFADSLSLCNFIYKICQQGETLMVGTRPADWPGRTKDCRRGSAPALMGAGSCAVHSLEDQHL